MPADPSTPDGATLKSKHADQVAELLRRRKARPTRCAFCEAKLNTFDGSRCPKCHLAQPSAADVASIKAYTLSQPPAETPVPRPPFNPLRADPATVNPLLARPPDPPVENTMAKTAEPSKPTPTHAAPPRDVPFETIALDPPVATCPKHGRPLSARGRCSECQPSGWSARKAREDAGEPVPPAKRTRFVPDPEVEAITAVLRAVERLTEESRERVFTYVKQRLDDV